MWKDGWGQNVSFGRQMNFFCQNGKVETGPSCVKSIHVNIWFQWNHAKTESDCPGISLWFNQETIHKVRIWEITVSSRLQWSNHWNWRGHTVSKNICIDMYTIFSNSAWDSPTGLSIQASLIIMSKCAWVQAIFWSLKFSFF